MKLLVSQDVGKELDRLISEYSEIYILTAWATSRFPLFDKLLERAENLKKCIVGLHFYQTDPEFISSFMTQNGVRFIKNPEGIFHPKVYLFKGKKGKWECIIGSANFTKGAFRSNYEISILVDSADAPVEFLESIEIEIEHYWNEASIFTEDDLEDYRQLWARYRPRLNGLSTKYRRNKKEDLVIDLLSMSWDEYLRKITTEDKYHSTGGRLLLLSKVRKAFKKYGKFKLMPLDIRTAIAGFNNNPIVRNKPDWNWGWFGSMVGSGVFKHTVKENNKYLSSALDFIPMDGPISKSDFNRFKKEFMKSFSYKNPIGVATRLLCVKRPDYFVGINKANKNALCEAFDSKKTLNLDEYWEEFIAKIISTTWWNSPTPENTDEIELYKARAAFLDAIYYEPI